MSGINTDRRSFLKLMGLAGGGLVLSVPLSGCSAAAPYPNSRAAEVRRRRL